VKARKVKGLDPAGPFADNARRIVAVRAQEVLDIAARAQDPAQATALHDLRIAAKRLRYVLDLTGPPDVVKQLKGLQDLLGELHDCDVQLPGIRTLARELPDREAVGVRTVAVQLATRRATCFERFHQQWPSIERSLAALVRVEVSR
jgi:CHAD domain-containing protein